MNRSDHPSQALAQHASKVLKLSTATLGEEFRYQSLTLCVLDAVFSITIRYGAVQALVRRYCQMYEVIQFRPSDAFPALTHQEPVSSFLARVTSVGTAKFASDILKNKCLTSPRGGILKSEACKRFAEALKAHRVEYFQDFVAAAIQARISALRTGNAPEPPQPRWLAHFGGLSQFRTEIESMQKEIDAAFERIDPEDWK